VYCCVVRAVWYFEFTFLISDCIYLVWDVEGDWGKSGNRVSEEHCVLGESFVVYSVFGMVGGYNWCLFFMDTVITFGNFLDDDTDGRNVFTAGIATKCGV